MDWIQLTNAPLLWGREIDTTTMVCPYCETAGQFKIVFQDVRVASANRFQDAQFRVLKCTVCANCTFVLTSEPRTISFQPNNGRRETCWPPQYSSIKAQEVWPERAGQLYVQAAQAFSSKSWDAALAMSRASMQSILKDMNAPKGTIEAQIQSLTGSGKLPPAIGEWANEIRKNGNSVLHGDLDFEADEEVAREVVSLNFYLFEYLYTLPDKIDKIRQAKQQR